MACSERARRRASWKLKLCRSDVVLSGFKNGPMTHEVYFMPLSPSRYCPSEKYTCGYRCQFARVYTKASGAVPVQPCTTLMKRPSQSQVNTAFRLYLPFLL